MNKKKEKVLMASLLSGDDIVSLFDNPNFYGVLFFEHANGILTIDEQQVSIEHHCILFYYPYQKLSLDVSFKGYFIQFHPDFFCIDIHAKDIGCQGLLFNNFFNDLLLKCTKEEFQNLLQFYSNIQEELLKKEIGQLDMVSSQLKMFLIRSVRIKTEKQLEKFLFRDNLHHQIEKLIERHFYSQPSPEYYAKQLDISLSSFNRLCKKYFQNNFITILNLKRIAAAKNKLFLTNIPIKDVAYEVGYNDPLYFSRVFRKHSGISPKEFRKQLKNNRLV